MNPDPLRRLRGRIGAFGQEQIAEAAVRRGWLSETDFEACLDEADREKASVIDVLVARGLLKPEQLKELLSSEPEAEAREAAARGGLAVPLAVSVAGDAARFGKYVLVEEIGRGGMGIVHKAWQGDLGRWVALKRLRSDVPANVARFLREGRLAAQLHHPNLIPIHEVGEIDGVPYLVMALIDGGSLDGRRLAIRDALEVIRSVALAVHELHQAGIVHRDIKPGNIMLDKSERAYLGDFSLACTEEAAPGLSRPGVFLGTPSFAPPEQIRGERARVGPRSDVYSLGATLYALLTGEVPYSGKTTFEVIRRALEEDPVPLRSRRPDVNHQIQTIVDKAMRKAPDDRYASAREFAADIRRYLDGETLHARPPGLASRLAWRARRHWKGAAAAGALAAILAAALGIQAIARSAAHSRTAASITRAERIFGEAERLIEAGPATAAAGQARLDEARAILATAVAEDPGSTPAWLQLGFVERLRGDAAAASRALDRAILLDPAERRARFEYARLRLERALWIFVEAYPFAVLPPPCCDRRDFGLTCRWLPDESLAVAQELTRAARADLAKLADDPGSPFGRRGLADAFSALVDLRLSEARELCTTELRSGVPEPEFAVILGLANLLSGRTDEARAELDRLLARRPDYATGYLARAACQETPEAAIADCGSAIALRPSLAVAFLNRAAFGVVAGLQKRAGADLDRAQVLEPERPSIRYWNGALLARLSGLTPAEEEALAIETGKPTAAACWLRGMLALRPPNADMEAAIASFSRGLELERDHLPLRFLRLHLNQVHRNRPEAVLEDIEHLQRHPLATPRFAVNKAEALLHLKRYAEAGEVLDEFLARHPGDVRALMRRSEAFFYTGRVQDAEIQMDRAVEADPKNAAARFRRGVMRYNRRDYDGCIADVAEGLTTDPEASPAVRQCLARSLAARERWAEAIEQFDLLLRRPDPDPAWMASRGDCYGRLGRYDEALADLNRAVERADNAVVRQQRGRVRMEMGRLDDARADLDRAAELDPRSATARLLRGDVHALKGKPDDARVDYLEAVRLDPGLREAVDARLERLDR